MDSKYLMTEEEGIYWDDYFIKNPPKVDPAKNRILTGEGPVARMALSLRDLDPDAAEYVSAQASATHQTKGQVVSTIIREKIAREDIAKSA
jgi:hypothetical protein